MHIGIVNRLARACVTIFTLSSLAGVGVYALSSLLLQEPNVPPDPPPAPIEPALARALLQARPDEDIRVIVYLKEQSVPEAIVHRAGEMAAARARLVSALRATAERAQAPLIAYLAAARAAGTVESYIPLWIFNGIVVSARPAFIRDLAAHPSVSSIRLDHYRQWVAEPAQQPLGPGETPTVEWGVSRIRADQVWSTLHISGSHAVVASMDTGVDWLHPALHTSYRGYDPRGLHNHLYNWYDATGLGALYPVDGHGHGTHTLGVIVGQGGIGVAPGARWIAVRVLNNQGYGYDSWVHLGFQWLLAPGGDPTRAPDVVNCSWGNENSALETFRPDLRALRAAGIFAAFAAGNEGPAYRTVRSPASLPEAFAVGASDQDDEVGYFSSRGPSPWGEVRPHVVAPGVRIRSSLPGGAYFLWDGTSVATPHVVGSAALLRAISPTVSVAQIAHLITSTAVPITVPVPNNIAGWGRVDSWAAAVVLAQPGFISGTVRRAGDGTPIPGAQVEAVALLQTGGGNVSTARDGSYRMALAPGVYDLTASAFGYAPATVQRVTVVTSTTRVVDFVLPRLPFGVVRGRITDAATGRPLTATVTVQGTPVAATAGEYAFELPAGTHTLSARRIGYRMITATVAVQAGEVTTADLALPPAPSILVVDSGAWYYGSQAAYFHQALDDLAYPYDTWRIKHLPADLPPSSTLSAYDIVVWSAPLDAPGYLGADEALVGYLDGGGRLLLSGQDVGYWDGGGALGYWSDYYGDYLKALFINDGAPSRVLHGTSGELFAGLSITITGEGGANNQTYPDEVEVADDDAAAAVWRYQLGGYGGIRASTCLTYRSLYFSFGFEAINDRSTRREVMRRAIEWLAAPPPRAGLRLTYAALPKVGPPGSVVTHTVRIRHTGQAGVTDTVLLGLDGADWTTRLSTSSLRLAPCATDTIVISVTIPRDALWNASDVVTLTARSSISPALRSRIILTTRSPAPILLVDDDRWYNQEEKYEAALRAVALPYDYWRTGQNWREPPGSSPTLDLLRLYPIVLWYTGYDWYAPVTSEEEAVLRAYLDGGGRLFLSSQEFLYYHHADPLARIYLGIASYTEHVTPTLVTGVPENVIGDRLGPYRLDYPFRNLSDAVLPAPGVPTLFRDQERRPVALGHRVGDYKTVFFSFPFEALPEAERPEVMERIVGWLSWLGSSTLVAGRKSVLPGAALVYTATLRNDGPQALSVSFSNTLPLAVTLIPGSLTGPASYLPSVRQVRWEGRLAPREELTFTYGVTVSLAAGRGSWITNTAVLTLEEQDLHFHRDAVVRVGGADLSPSALDCAPPAVRPGGRITCVLRLVNAGPEAAQEARAVIQLPAGSRLVPDSAHWTGVGTIELLTGTLLWKGPLASGGRITLTYQVSLSLIHI
ncbi:MAG: S8 family serine peptidase, partial [Anaerolineae bacterium]|nr:S8 family serine peptidase [Anaerolineae bacterium]